MSHYNNNSSTTAGITPTNIPSPHYFKHLHDKTVLCIITDLLLFDVVLLCPNCPAPSSSSCGSTPCRRIRNYAVLFKHSVYVLFVPLHLPTILINNCLHVFHPSVLLFEWHLLLLKIFLLRTLFSKLWVFPVYEFDLFVRIPPILLEH